jgi:hypothetical protein
VRGKLVIFGVGDQGGHADDLEGVVCDVCVGDEQVEVVTLGAHGEQTVDELVDVPDVVIRHRKVSRNRRHQAGRGCRGESPQCPHDELPVDSLCPGRLDDGGGASR